jgi:hypothetical protein
LSVKKARRVKSYRPKVAKLYTEIIMENSGIARGNIACQAHKKLRRQRILDLAAHLIASDKIEGFTTNPLALEAEVSTPTIHSLFEKNGIIKVLVSNLIEHMNGFGAHSPSLSPLSKT